MSQQEDPTKGMPGEPGHDAEGPTGGAGGQGGTGGAGEQTGGTGGMGGPGGSAIGKKRGDVERTLSQLVLAVVLLFLVLLVLAIVGWVSLQRQVDRNETAGSALCALRADLDLRIKGSKDFLEVHPRGIPGIPASLIRQSLNNSIRTRETLENLKCKEAK